MTMNTNARLDEQVFSVQATTLAALSGTTGDGVYVSLKNYARMRIILDVANGATPTGGVVTLKQATTVAGAGEKALTFTRMLSNVDVAASQALVETPVSSSTFTTNTTANKRLRYVMDVRAEDLDINNGFRCVRIDVDLMSGATAVATYDLYGPRYTGANPMVD